MTTQVRAGAEEVRARTNFALMQSTYRGELRMHDQSVLCGSQNRANEPNGSLGKLYRPSIRDARLSLTSPQNGANEPNGSLDKLYRLFRATVCQASARTVNRANEPNGSLGKICR